MVTDETIHKHITYSFVSAQTRYDTEEHVQIIQGEIGAHRSSLLRPGDQRPTSATNIAPPSGQARGALGIRENDVSEPAATRSGQSPYVLSERLHTRFHRLDGIEFGFHFRQEVRQHSLDQGVAVRKVTIQRPDPHTGVCSDRSGRELESFVPQVLSCKHQQSLTISQSVRARLPPRAHDGASHRTFSVPPSIAIVCPVTNPAPSDA